MGVSAWKEMEMEVEDLLNSEVMLLRGKCGPAYSEMLKLTTHPPSWMTVHVSLASRVLVELGAGVTEGASYNSKTCNSTLGAVRDYAHG